MVKLDEALILLPIDLLRLVRISAELSNICLRLRCLQPLVVNSVGFLVESPNDCATITRPEAVYTAFVRHRAIATHA